MEKLGFAHICALIMWYIAWKKVQRAFSMVMSIPSMCHLGSQSQPALKVHHVYPKTSHLSVSRWPDILVAALSTSKTLHGYLCLAEHTAACV